MRPLTRFLTRRLVPVAIGASSALAPAQPVETPPAASDSIHARTFEHAWRLIRDTHFDPTYNGVDWQAVHDELAPRAREAGTIGEVRAIISDMLSRLGESHFALIPAEAADVLPGEEGVDAPPEGHGDANPDAPADAGGEDVPHPDDAPADVDPDEPLEGESYGGGDAWLGIDIRPVGDALVVTRVEPGSPADEAGVRPGWAITRIGWRDVGERLASLRELDLAGASVDIIVWQIFSGLLSGEIGTRARLAFLDADDRERVLALERVRRPGTMAKFGNLPPLNAHTEWSWLDPSEFGLPDGARIGYIRFNIFLMPTARGFEQAVFDLREADGIVVDIRGNLGGMGALAIGMGGRLIDEPVSLGTMQMRGASLQFNINPQYVTSWGEATRPYAGRLAVVTDAVSASTSEIFAGGLQAVGRAKVFGQTTAGMALPAAMDRLPNGDVLLHAIADYHTSAGDRLEKTGVIPDVPVPVRREDLLAGTDAPLARAVRWLASDEE